MEKEKFDHLLQMVWEEVDRYDSPDLGELACAESYWS